MFKTVKATLRKFSELSWPERIQLKNYMKHSRSYKEFDGGIFNNPSLQVASASNAAGETVVYCPVQKVFMVSGFFVSPTATREDAKAAGDLIDAELACEAQRAGVSSMLLVIPADHPSSQYPEWSDAKTVKIFERKFNQTVGTGGISLRKPAQATQQFLN